MIRSVLTGNEHKLYKTISYNLPYNLPIGTSFNSLFHDQIVDNDCKKTIEKAILFGYFLSNSQRTFWLTSTADCSKHSSKEIEDYLEERNVIPEGTYIRNRNKFAFEFVLPSI